MEFQGSQWESQFVTTNKRPIGPRMSNERIDLTQYEMIRGPWEPSPWDKDEVIDKSPKGRDGTIALVVPWGKNREVSEVHKKAIANLPNIITELKRCYEREDVATEALLENAEMMREYVGQIIDLKRKIGMLQE